jgi:hypothetical protein
VSQLREGYEMNPPRSPSRSGRDRGHPDRLPLKGEATAGIPFRPSDMPPDQATEQEGARPQAAPAPGVPLSSDRLEKLKRAAKTARTFRSRHSQEDRRKD